MDDTKAIPARHTPSTWERARGGFIQGWRDDTPNRSAWGKAQGYIVATALAGIGLILAGAIVAAAIHNF